MNQDGDEDEEFGNMFQLRESADEIFIFEDIKLEKYHDGQELRITFIYNFCHEHCFASTLFLKDPILIDLIWEDQSIGLGRILFSIGMVSLTWYWMGFACERIQISANLTSKYVIATSLIDYWQEAYQNILSEYLYVNKLAHKSFTIRIEEADTLIKNNIGSNNNPTKSIVSSPEHESDQQKALNPTQPCSLIVPLGGGKDSLVVWHLAIQQQHTPLLLHVSDGYKEYEANWRIPAIQKATQSAFLHLCHDFLDSDFLKYSRSYLTPVGHPWAALVLFDSLLISYLHQIPEVWLGHEKSADEGNGVFVGEIEVNHQYDKSSSYLQLTSQYIARYISTKVTAKSALNHLWELEIAKIFCEEPALEPFFPLFLSCNEPVAYTKWCGKCDKCAFICLLLSAYLDQSIIVNTIFQGIDMLANKALIPVFLSLLGSQGKKPFDCVGTIEEVKAAVALIVAKLEKQSKSIIDGDHSDQMNLKEDAEGDIPIVIQRMIEYTSMT